MNPKYDTRRVTREKMVIRHIVFHRKINNEEYFTDFGYGNVIYESPYTDYPYIRYHHAGVEFECPIVGDFIAFHVAGENIDDGEK